MAHDDQLVISVMAARQQERMADYLEIWVLQRILCSNSLIGIISEHLAKQIHAQRFQLWADLHISNYEVIQKTTPLRKVLICHSSIDGQLGQQISNAFESPFQAL